MQAEPGYARWSVTASLETDASASVTLLGELADDAEADEAAEVFRGLLELVLVVGAERGWWEAEPGWALEPGEDLHLVENDTGWSFTHPVALLAGRVRGELPAVRRLLHGAALALQEREIVPIRASSPLPAAPFAPTVGEA